MYGSLVQVFTGLEESATTVGGSDYKRRATRQLGFPVKGETVFCKDVQG